MKIFILKIKILQMVFYFENLFKKIFFFSNIDKTS